MSLFRRSETHQQPAAQPPVVPSGLVSLTKAAAVSLDKHQLTGRRAAVYLVLDHSGSMQSHYQHGDVQRLAEQTLALSANLDDDGTVPTVFFHHNAEKPIDIHLDAYEGVIERTHEKLAWGTTNYVAAMDKVIKHYRKAKATDPALVVFQTDGSPTDEPAAERALIHASTLPIFWFFVGFGYGAEFLNRLPKLQGRTVDNSAAFHAHDPKSVKDSTLYDAITKGYARWLADASAAGIVR